MYKEILINDDVMFSDETLRIFLEQAASGCISGRISEWPQLKPAIRWAIKEIDRLNTELEVSKLRSLSAEKIARTHGAKIGWPTRKGI